MLLKNLFKFLFVEELAQLESCKNELEEARVNYNKLLNDYNTLAKSYNENVGKVIERVVEIPIIPRDFESKGEMQAWFNKNKIDELEYIPTTFDCENFSIETQKAALKDGFIVNMELDMTGSYYGNGKAHMLCGCRIGNMYYIIEPQNDRIVFETRLD